MMLHYFAHQDVDGEWHTVYQTPGSPLLTSVAVGMGCSRALAQKEANALNQQQAKQHAASMAAAVPGERKLIPGFYTDSDAA